MTGNMRAMEEHRIELGRKVTRARLERGWSKEQAARQAGINSITWKRIEDGKGVQDAKRYAALRTLGLNEMGEVESARPSRREEVMNANISESTKAYILGLMDEQSADPESAAKRKGA